MKYVVMSYAPGLESERYSGSQDECRAYLAQAIERASQPNYRGQVPKITVGDDGAFIFRNTASFYSLRIEPAE